VNKPCILLVKHLGNHICQIGNPGTGITDKDDIPSRVDKLTGTADIDNAFVNRGLEGKIKKSSISFWVGNLALL
jgi:hypothetical protein